MITEEFSASRTAAGVAETLSASVSTLIPLLIRACFSRGPTPIFPPHYASLNNALTVTQSYCSLTSLVLHDAYIVRALVEFFKIFL